MQATNFARFQLPTHDGFELTHEIGMARVHEQTRRINLKILSFEVKTLVLTTNSLVSPFAADPQIRSGGGHAEGDRGREFRRTRGFDSPPLRPLLGIGNRLKNASRWGCDEDLRQNRVVIGSDACSGHIFDQILNQNRKPPFEKRERWGGRRFLLMASYF